MGDNWPGIGPREWSALEAAARTGATDLDAFGFEQARRGFDDTIRASAGLRPVQDAWRAEQHRLRDIGEALGLTADLFGEFARLVHRTRHRILDVVDATETRILAIAETATADDSVEEREARVAAALHAARQEVAEIAADARNTVGSPGFAMVNRIAELLGHSGPWHNGAAGPNGESLAPRAPSGSGDPRLPHDDTRGSPAHPGRPGPGAAAVVPAGAQHIPQPESAGVEQRVAGEQAPVLPTATSEEISGVPIRPAEPLVKGGTPTGGGTSTEGDSAGPPASGGVGGGGGEYRVPPPWDGPAIAGRNPVASIDTVATPQEPAAATPRVPAAAMPQLPTSSIAHGTAPAVAAAPGELTSESAAVSQVSDSSVNSAMTPVPQLPVSAASPAATGQFVPMLPAAMMAAGGAGAGSPSTAPVNNAVAQSITQSAKSVPTISARPPVEATTPAPRPGVSPPSSQGGLATPGNPSPTAGEVGKARRNQTGPPEAKMTRTHETDSAAAGSSLVHDALGTAMAAAAQSGVVGERMDGDLVLARTLLRSVLAAVDCSPLAPAWAVSVLRHPGGVGVFLTSNEGRGALPAGLYLPRQVSTPWVWEIARNAPWEGISDPARMLVEFATVWRTVSGARLSAVTSSQPIAAKVAAAVPSVSFEGEITAAPELDLAAAAPGLLDRLGWTAAPRLLARVAAVPDRALGDQCARLARDAHDRLAASLGGVVDGLGSAGMRAHLLSLVRRRQPVAAHLWQELRDADDLLAALMLSHRIDVSAIPLGELRFDGRGRALKAVRALHLERCCNELVLLLADTAERAQLRDAVYLHSYLADHPAVSASTAG